MITQVDIFPDMPFALLVCLLVLSAVLVLWRGGRGRWFRLSACVVLFLLLCNPAVVGEQRDPVSSTLLIVADHSSSQSLGDRQAVTDTAVERLRAEAEKLDSIDTQVVIAPDCRDDTGAKKTCLYAEIGRTLQSIPADRMAGVVFVTDGQVHDIPEDISGMADVGPVHTLLTGGLDEMDRKVVLVQSPGFGLVGKTVKVTARIEEQGKSPESLPLRVFLDGDLIDQRTVMPDEDVVLDIPVNHAGQNIIELETDVAENEISATNNRTAAIINGVRDRLKVLLVSGKPHMGERSWRNLLKSDPSVDLVHFTILRPPEKFDLTPSSELSLIAFPVRELFQEKIDDFDLIILDRYQHLSIFRSVYYKNMVDFVKKGGALLVASGPEFQGRFSMHTTGLSDILPVRPWMDYRKQAFTPALTGQGERHPVTNDLYDRQTQEKPDWGQWHGMVPTQLKSGNVVMRGVDDQPLLVLDYVEDGRIAFLASDNVWLWAKGYDGGGPYTELLRRLAHWLMKEPDLEEHQLRATIQNNTLTVSRRSREEGLVAPDVVLTKPDGSESVLSMQAGETGWFTASLPVEQTGIYRVTDGRLTALAIAGAVNAPENRDLLTTPEKLKPLAEHTGGQIQWLRQKPDIQLVLQGKSRSSYGGGGRLGLRDNQAYVVTGVRHFDLFPPYVALLLVFGLILAGWIRESRG